MRVTYLLQRAKELYCIYKTMSSKLLQLINNIMKSSNETIKKVMEETQLLV